MKKLYQKILLMSLLISELFAFQINVSAQETRAIALNDVQIYGVCSISKTKGKYVANIYIGRVTVPYKIVSVEYRPNVYINQDYTWELSIWHTDEKGIIRDFKTMNYTITEVVQVEDAPYCKQNFN